MTYATGRNGAPLQMLECHEADCPPDGPTVETIRKILLEDDPAALPPRGGKVKQAIRSQLRSSRFPDLPAPERFDEGSDQNSGKTKRRLRNPLTSVTNRLKRFQPTWKLSGLILLAAATIAKPWLVVAIVVAVVAAVVAIGAALRLIFGPVRCAKAATWVWTKYATRFPEQASDMTNRAQKISVMADNLAARLPANWTAGFYAPDFAPATSQPEKMGEDPFDRLNRDTRNS